MNKCIIFLLVVLTFFSRPFALGVDYTVFSMSLLLPFSFLLYKLSKKEVIYRYRILFWILFFYMIFFIFDFSFKGLVLSILNAVVAFFITSNIYYRRRFFLLFKNFVLILIILGLINFILEIIYSQSELIICKDIYLENKVYRFDLYFPLTWSSMLWPMPESMDFLGAVHARQYFFFIEPGMVPPFFISLIYIIWASPNERYKFLQIFILIIGILLSFSTGGPLLFFISYFVYFFFSRKRKLSILNLSILLFILFLAYYAYNYMPVFGRQAKIEISDATAQSVETHESIKAYVLLGSICILCLGLFTMKYKENKPIYITIVFMMAIGYLSNYIGFTFLSTMFLFWDEQIQKLPYQKDD